MTSLDRLKRYAIIVLAFFAAGFAGGCGGGGGGFSTSPQQLRSFDPNYLHDLKSLTHWAAFPVRVYFVPGPESTPERQAQARAGMRQWTEGTGGLIQFEVTPSASLAQISVQFVPGLDGNLIGWTSWTYDGSGNMQQASSKIATGGMSDGDIEWVAAHEFGHALGFDGHSMQSEDVMYASHVLGSDWALTVRDENTARTNYDWILTAGASKGRAVVWGPMATAEVKCYKP